MAILCIGESNYTISSKITEFPKENIVNYVNNRTDFGGGISGNVAYLLGKWGVETYIASSLGADDYGSKLKKEYESMQIKTEYLETNYDIPTIMAVELIDEKTKTCSEINISKARQLMKKADFKITPDLIFSDAYDYGASSKALNLNPKVLSVLAVTNENSETRELCKHFNYLIFTSSVAESTTGMKINFDEVQSLVRLYSALKEKYPNGNIIVTLEENGCLYSVNNEIKILPSIKEKIVSKSNYISVFCGSFLYSILKKYDLEKSLIYANIATSISMSLEGSRVSTPTLNEVINIYNAKYPVKSTPESTVTTDTIDKL